MKRNLKLEGRSVNHAAPATFTLPDGHYEVPTGDGGVIRINVSHGQAGIGVNVVGPGHDSLTFDVLTVLGHTGVRQRAREIDIAYYSPLDGYALAFRAWYDAPLVDGKHTVPYPGTREEWEDAQPKSATERWFDRQVMKA